MGENSAMIGVTERGQRAAVIGTTSWGTTLAIQLAAHGIPTTLWARTSTEAELLGEDRENHARLNGYPFPAALAVTADLDAALHGAGLVVICVPSNSFRRNVRLLHGRDLASYPVILGAAKGLELGTGLRMSQVVGDELGEEAVARYAVLSGPNLAGEVVQGMPSSTVIASRDSAVAVFAQGMLTSSTFRVYTNLDLVGVELGGSLKNILAIGAGMADGMGYGHNGKAAFISRGLAEITRLGVAAGANAQTFAGLAGVGDVIATCYSPLSRNRFVGQELARGRRLDEVLAALGQVAEGVNTVPAALLLAEQLGVEMPIAAQTRRVLEDGLDPRAALNELLSRAPTSEYPPSSRGPG
ncbi:MAG: NAD(P)-dependent glycerol-3-phosphate dehydrogenase [Chloroflexi bacterium]|nr:NAD(P)-dependent glycerol-3-phosphate dehydrogenase [Chloroflexota bacterium]